MTSDADFLFRPNWSTLRVHGPDSATWLNGIITCDVLAAASGRIVWGTLLSKQGKIVAELQVAGTSEELWVAVSGGDTEQVLTILDGYLVMEDAEIEHCDVQWIIGGADLVELTKAHGLAVGSLAWTNGPLFAAFGSASVVEKTLESAANRVLDEHEYREFLIRHGVPSFGVDYDGQDNLHAASLERRTVDWQKGCYLGQEVVCMQDMRGKVKKCLVRLVSAGDPVPAASVLDEKGEQVGQVKSTAGEVAIAQVVAPHFQAGSRLQAGGVAVEVQPLRID